MGILEAALSALGLRGAECTGYDNLRDISAARGGGEGGGAHIIRVLLEELLTRGGELVRELAEAGGGGRHDEVCVRFVRVV